MPAPGCRCSRHGTSIRVLSSSQQVDDKRRHGMTLAQRRHRLEKEKHALGFVVPGPAVPQEQPVGDPLPGGRRGRHPGPGRPLARHPRRPVGLDILAGDGDGRRVGDDQRGRLADRLRGHRHGPRRPDGDGHLLAALHAHVVPRRPAQAPAGGARRDPAVLLLRHAPDPARIRARPEREPHQRRCRPRPAAVRAVLRPVRPPDASRGRRGVHGRRRPSRLRGMARGRVATGHRVPGLRHLATGH